MSIDSIKKSVAVRAAEKIQNGMRVGLGTGSTAAFFIEQLGKRCKEGLKIQALCSSLATERMARRAGIPTIEEGITSLDLTVDGADEIDPNLQMIKGGGGALLREKVVAAMSKEVVIIVDETKMVKQLGKHPLPVEIIPFAKEATRHHIERLGFQGAFRKKKGGALFFTDNRNLIFDIHFKTPPENPEQVDRALKHLPGVVETGFFFHLATRVLIGFFDGQIAERKAHG